MAPEPPRGPVPANIAQYDGPVSTNSVLMLPSLIVPCISNLPIQCKPISYLLYIYVLNSWSSHIKAKTQEGAPRVYKYTD